MNTPEASFLTWQQQFNTEQDCLEHLKQLKWPNGFTCSRCAHDKGTELHCRQLTECNRCHKQISITSGTLFHSSNLPLLKWFWALYFIGSDKGSISALRLSKLIEVNWRTARLILTKVRFAMGHRDSIYRLSGTIELDDAFIGGKHKGKTAVLIACENRQKKAGFIAMKAVNAVNFKMLMTLLGITY